jgi:hypothetical protein
VPSSAAISAAKIRAIILGQPEFAIMVANRSMNSAASCSPGIGDGGDGGMRSKRFLYSQNS